MSGPGGIHNHLPGGGLPDPARLLGGGRGGPESARLFQGLVDAGLSPGQAFGRILPTADGSLPSLPGAHDHTGASSQASSAVDTATVAQVFNDMPRDIQRQVLQDADAIPQTVRSALDQLGITQPQPRGDAPTAASQPAASAEPQQVPAASAREATGFARAESAAAANTVAQAMGTGNAQSANAAGQTASAFAAQDRVAQANPFANGQALQVDRAPREGVLLQPGTRADAQVPARGPDAGNVVAMADRANAAQQQASAQTLPAFAQGRPDAVPAHAMATLAGATMLANPQGNPALAHPQAPTHVPAGTDAAAAQAREIQLAPAGHTVSGFLRRDLRKGTAPQAEQRRGDSLLAALLPGRRRRGADAEEQATATQWLFWILTIAAYGAVGLALALMIPGGASLTDGQGAPSPSGYALVVAALAAASAWWIGRRLSRGDSE